MRTLKAEGKQVISLGTGEPDFPTPAHVVDAAYKAAQDGQTQYTATAGTIDLRRAIAETTARDCGFAPEASEVIVTTGAKQAIFNAFMATLDPGDEVILAAPFWASYADMIKVCEGRVVAVPTLASDGFRLKPEALRAAITSRTRWLLLNSPGNPSGAVLSAADMKALGEVLRANPHVGVISDEIYQHICYTEFTSFRAAVPDLADRTLIINGASKTYSMTGWRLGWGIGPKKLIDAMIAVQGQVTAGTSSISQAAALAALQVPQDFRQERCDDFRQRRDLVVAALNATGRIHCPVPDGAFYVFADCTYCVSVRLRRGFRPFPAASSKA